MRSKNDRSLRVAFVSLLAATIVGGAAGSARGQFDFTGACCTSNGSCRVISALLCNSQQGDNFLGVGTTCETGTCSGACCLPDGGCQDLDGPECDSLPGDYRGFGTTCASESCGTALGTQFTYQGRLKASGMPIVSNADFQFALFDAETDGAQAGPAFSVDDVGLVNGLFTVSLDFGPTAFNGEARWIEVAVRSPAGAGSFTTLTPRQPLTAVPFALQTRGIATDANGNVGIGTANPRALLDLRYQSIEAGIQVLGNADHRHSFLTLGQDPSHYFKMRYDGTSDTWDLIANNGGGEDPPWVRVQRATGRVGIGTTDPNGGLHVVREPLTNGGTLTLEGTTHSYLAFFPEGAEAGREGYFGFASANTPDITIATEVPEGRIVLASPEGAYYATAGDENLRIVRGTVSGNGTIVAGAGFSVDHPATGTYVIHFVPNFPADPTVTVTKDFFSFDDIPTAFVDDVNFRRFTVGLSLDNAPIDGRFHFIAVGPR